MVEISLSGSGEGLGRAIARGYSTKRGFRKYFPHRRHDTGLFTQPRPNADIHATRLLKDVFTRNLRMSHPPLYVRNVPWQPL